MLPNTTVGKYRLDSRLGAGGCGEVWKAWDTALQRWVALKFILRHESDDLARFEREARLAANLAHPNVAAIYEHFVEAGVPVIAMQYVEGRTLNEAARSLPPRELVTLLRDAARAMAHAHRQGVLHRDLKPANLMVDAGSRVFVMDFGLARDVRVGSTLTASGMMVGTPAYMSPEQARGEGRLLDERTDVYGLGATMYAVLAGHPPFHDGDVLTLCLRILEDDPPPIPSVDPDLGAMVLRCLEKDPARRYPTCDELADDLDRWLAGDPVLAKAPGTVRRAVRFLSRRRGPAAAVAIAVVLLGATAFVTERLLRRGSQAAGQAHADLLEEMRRTSGTCLTAALDLRRAGNLAGMREQAAKLEEVCRRVMTAVPASAEPHIRLGRIHRVLMRYDDALREQEEALRKEPGNAEARLERGLLRMRRYEGRIAQVQATWWQRPGAEFDPGARVPSRTDIEAVDAPARELKERVLDDLRGLPQPLPRALVAWLTEPEDGAAQKLFTQSTKESPEIEEAWEYLGRMARYSSYWEVARSWYTRGLAVDRGYVPFLTGRGATWFEEGWQTSREGRDPASAYEQALADLAAASRLDPDDPLPWESAASIETVLANHLWRSGRDGRDRYRAAAEKASKVLALGSPSAAARRIRGQAWAGLAAAAINLDEDPREFLRKAREDFDAAIAAEPTDADGWRRRGVLGVNWAQSERRGATPDPAHLEEAIRDLGEAIRLDPTSAEAWSTRGRARAQALYGRVARGEDVSAGFDQALEDADRGIQLDSGSAHGWVCRGLIRHYRGQWQARRGGDPDAGYRGAWDDFSEAIRRGPANGEPHLQRGIVGGDRALQAQSRGADASELFRRAIADFDEAVRINPKRSEALVHRAAAHLNFARFLQARAQDPSVHHAAARRDIDAALAINPRSPKAWLARGGLLLQEGQRTEAVDVLTASVDAFTKAADLEPQEASHRLRRAQARVSLATAVERGGGRSLPGLREAVDDFDAAIRLDKNLAEAWSSRGNTRGAVILASRQEPDFDAILRAEYDALEIDFAEARRLDPTNAEVRWRHGQCLQIVSQWRRALEEYEAAIRLNPSLEPRLRSRIAACRAKLDQ